MQLFEIFGVTTFVMMSEGSLPPNLEPVFQPKTVRSFMCAGICTFFAMTRVTSLSLETEFLELTHHDTFYYQSNGSKC